MNSLRILDRLAAFSYRDIIPPKPHVTLHRLKIEKWRIVYAIDDEEIVVDVLTVRQRPPYDYGDLDELLQAIL